MTAASRPGQVRRLLWGTGLFAAGAGVAWLAGAWLAGTRLADLLACLAAGLMVGRFPGVRPPGLSGLPLERCAALEPHARRVRRALRAGQAVNALISLPPVPVARPARTPIHDTAEQRKGA